MKRLAPNAGNGRQPLGRLSPSTETGGGVGEKGGCSERRKREPKAQARALSKAGADCVTVLNLKLLFYTNNV